MEHVLSPLDTVVIDLERLVVKAAIDDAFQKGDKIITSPVVPATPKEGFLYIQTLPDGAWNFRDAYARVKRVQPQLYEAFRSALASSSFIEKDLLHEEQSRRCER